MSKGHILNEVRVSFNMNKQSEILGICYYVILILFFYLHYHEYYISNQNKFLHKVSASIKSFACIIVLL